MKKLSILLITVLFFSACARKQTIIPLAPAKSPSEKMKERAYQQTGEVLKDSGNVKLGKITKHPYKDKVYYIKGKYRLDRMEANRPINSLPLTGNFANLLLNIIFKIGGKFSVDVDPIPFDLTKIDLSKVKEFYITGMEFYSVKDGEKIYDDEDEEEYAPILNKEKEVIEEDSDYLDGDIKIPTSNNIFRFGKRNLKFIKTLNLFIQKGEKEIELLSYDRQEFDSDDDTSKQCDYKCIKMNVNERINIIDFIKKETIQHEHGESIGKFLIVRPEVKIGKTPSKSFVIGGHVDFEIGISIY